MFRFTDAQSKYIKELYNNKQLSDVTILIAGSMGAEKEQMHAHKFLLCVSSDYMRNMFTGEGNFRETKTNTIDLSGYDAGLMKICIKSLYDPEEANAELAKIIEDDPEIYGAVLDIVSYLGLNKLQISLETIGLSIFDKIWTVQICRMQLMNAVVQCSGNKKSKLAQKFIAQLATCYDIVRKSPGDDSPDIVRDASEYIKFMQSSDSQSILRITKLCASDRTLTTTAFKLWAHWYIIHEDKQAFDEAISKKAVEISKINHKEVMDEILSIKGTITYNWLMQQFPGISKDIKRKMCEIQKAKDAKDAKDAEVAGNVN
jgi:hypothetical protein